MKEREKARIALLIYSTRKILGKGKMYASYEPNTERIGLTEYKPEEKYFYLEVDLEEGLPSDFEEKYKYWKKERSIEKWKVEQD